MKRTPRPQYRKKANEREDSLAHNNAPSANRRSRFMGILSPFQLQDAFLNSATAARIVSCVPDEMFRCGFDIEVADGVEFDARAFRSLWDELKANKALAQAYLWSRLDGGGAVVLMGEADDMQELMPGTETITGLRAVSCNELEPWPGYESQTDPAEFGMPLMWAVDPLMGGTDIQMHNSRLVKIKGRPIPPIMRKNMATSQRYFGLSALQGILDDIYDFDDCHAWASLLLKRLQQLVYKTEGAADQCESRAGVRSLQAKVDFVDGVRSAQSTIAIDKDTDDITLLNGSLTGVKDLLDSKRTKLTQSTGIPQIILSGDASGGLNNSAEGAMQAWQNYIAREQENHGTPAVSALVSLMYPDLEFSVVWRPMQEETAQQMADRIYKLSQADAGYTDHYILSVDEVRNTLARRGDYVLSKTKPIPPSTTPPTREEEEAARG